MSHLAGELIDAIQTCQKKRNDIKKGKYKMNEQLAILKMYINIITINNI